MADCIIIPKEILLAIGIIWALVAVYGNTDFTNMCEWDSLITTFIM